MRRVAREADGRESPLGPLNLTLEGLRRFTAYGKTTLLEQVRARIE